MLKTIDDIIAEIQAAEAAQGETIAEYRRTLDKARKKERAAAERLEKGEAVHDHREIERAETELELARRIREIYELFISVLGRMLL